MIISVIPMLILALTHVMSFDAIMERRYSAGVTAAGYGLFCVPFIVLGALKYYYAGDTSFGMMFAAFAFTFLTGLIIFIILSTDPMCKKLFLAITYANVYCVDFFLATVITYAVLPSITGTGVMYTRNILLFILILPVVLLYRKYGRPFIRSLSTGRKQTWYAITLVSALFLVLLALCVSQFYPGDALMNRNLLLFLISTVLYASVVWLIFDTIKRLDEENRAGLIEQNMEYLKRQIAGARESQLKAKTLRHDIRHHVKNLSALIKEGKTGDALKYIEEYTGILYDTGPREYCPHTTVNAILNNFGYRAVADGITPSICADVGETSAIADTDYVAILSNLLENALNGCRAWGPGGEIKVRIGRVSDKTVIVVVNPCVPDLVVENGMIKEKGIGIESILLTVRKYDGDIRYEKKNGTLNACVILNA